MSRALVSCGFQLHERMLMDVLTSEQRSFNMSSIKGKNTRPEMMVRKWLWTHGYRYRIHRKDLPGKPDIILPKYRAVIFVHGCFWHRHGCPATTTPASRQEFWLAKFQENVNRDKRNIDALLATSWRVMIIWECSLRGKNAAPELTITQVANFLHSNQIFSEFTNKTS